MAHIYDQHGNRVKLDDMKPPDILPAEVTTTTVDGRVYSSGETPQEMTPPELVFQPAGQSPAEQSSGEEETKTEPPPPPASAIEQVSERIIAYAQELDRVASETHFDDDAAFIKHLHDAALLLQLLAESCRELLALGGKPGEVVQSLNRQEAM